MVVVYAYINDSLFFRILLLASLFLLDKSWLSVCHSVMVASSAPENGLVCVMSLWHDGGWCFDPVWRALNRLHLAVSEPTVSLSVRGGLGGGTTATF